MIWLAGCVDPGFDTALEPEDPPADTVVSVDELWNAPGFTGTVSTISPLIVTSPRTADGTAFYASDPLGGARSGVRIEAAPTLLDLPPPVGTRIQVTAYVVRAGPGPILELAASSDVRRVGLVGIPPVSPYVPESGLDHSLVSVRGVTVTSATDPLGEADLNGVDGLGGLFGAGPGWNRTGDLVGILDGGRVSPRGTDDWSGVWAGDPPIGAGLADLAALADGTPVVVDDLVLATPWSRDGRWAVVQDAVGVGRWVDAGAYSLWASVVPGDVGRWTGEVRHGDGTVLRVWDPPEVTGVRAVLQGDDLVDGAIVEIEVTGIGPTDAWGDRPTDGPILDDRFVDLGGDLPDPVTLLGAGIAPTKSGGRSIDHVRLAPLP